MDIPIHMMMTGGFIVGIFAVTSGYIYAVWIDKKLSIPLRDSPDARVSQIEALSKTESDNLPPLWFSSLPILLPVLFISMNGITEAFMGDASDGSVIYYVRGVISFIGDKNIALVIGALVALLLLSRQKSGDPGLISSSVQNALMSGGVIILITAAGGAFGGMLQQTGISLKIAELTREYQMALIPLAFIITAVVRTAQGSATVSMITAAGILSGMSGNGGLDYHVLYLGLAIACGSKPFPWMNDSGFWIISRMSNFTPGETLKSFSSMLAVMGVTGLIITYIGALVFPMV
jgi:GntP family gluconate:H+ symporter